jgi:hypothetical protein
MKKFIVVVLILFFGLIQTSSAQTYQFTTLDGENYTNSTIKRVDPDGLLVAYPDGVVKLKFKNLPKEVGVKYGYDPTKEASFLNAKRSNELTRYQENIQPKSSASISTSPEAQAICDKISKYIARITGSLTDTTCIPAKGSQPDELSLAIIISKPIFREPRSKKDIA